MASHTYAICCAVSVSVPVPVPVPVLQPFVYLSTHAYGTYRLYSFCKVWGRLFTMKEHTHMYTLGSIKNLYVEIEWKVRDSDWNHEQRVYSYASKVITPWRYRSMYSLHIRALVIQTKCTFTFRFMYICFYVWTCISASAFTWKKKSKGLKNIKWSYFYYYINHYSCW